MPGVTLDSSTVHLEGIEVAVAPRARRLERVGFYERERMGSGTFLTNEEIREKPRVSDAIQGISGITAMPRGSSGIGFRQTRFGEPCSLPVYIDGILTAASSVNRLRPEDVEAIEVYDGAETPARFNPEYSRGSTCGAIVVWTRNGSG